MRDKQLSNPFSTGGGGGHFEAHVQASFVILMLTGGVVPCLPPWPITEIKLQGRVKGYNTDDFIVGVEDQVSKRKRKLLGQIKHRISITQGDDTFSEVIRAAWNDFNNSEIFNKEKDMIALITGPLSATDFHNVQWLLNQARHTKDVEEFEQQVTRAKFSPPKSEEKLNVIKYHLKLANNNHEVTSLEFYSFLNHFYLLGYDLGEEEGVILSLLHSHISQFQQNPQLIWARVVDVVHSWNKEAGTITLDRLPNDLKDFFKQPVISRIPSELMVQPEKSGLDWKQHPYASTVALANLLGSWNDNNEADVETVKVIINKDYDVWLPQAREMLQLNGSPFSHQNGFWKIDDRPLFWDILSTHILDRDLDTFKQIAVTVLAETDPAFELDPEHRFAASIYGKVTRYSHALRKGVADGLALLGTRGNTLIHCSPYKAENTVVLAIREIFEHAGWELWGSLNDLLPTLGEASPDEFLTSVENALRSEPCPFDKLFSQEGQGVSGRNYLTGLLWALEGIAWNEQYLVRTCVVLGELASHDPGGNWANRPANSLVSILLPWFPQTIAPIEKRKVAVQTLYKEFPKIAWQLLIDLLPDQHQISTGTYKPVWRNSIPEEWKEGATQGEYWEQISFYSEMLVSMAKEDIDKLSLLIDHLADLPQNAFNQMLKLLSSDKIIGRSEEELFPLWERLMKFTQRHRAFSDAKWALKDDLLLRIEDVAVGLTPSHPTKLYQRLFVEDDFDLLEEEAEESWEEKNNRLDKLRQDALKEIIKLDGIDGVIQFTKEVESPIKVGYPFGKIADKMIDDKLIPQYLDTTDGKFKNFISGYIWSRYQIHGWSWADDLDKDNWNSGQIVCFLNFLPFEQETWIRVKRWLKDLEHEYWKKVDINPFQARDSLEEATEKLLEHRRPYAAIQCLDKMRYLKKPLDISQCLRALELALTSVEPTYLLNTHGIIEIIKVLQDSQEVSESDLFSIEWAYLKILDRYSGVKPKYIEKALSNTPEFFCEIIRVLYRSKKSDVITETNDHTKAIAENAWQLLRNWRSIPGAQEDGNFNGEFFLSWLHRVKEICMESGHLEVALTKIGQVLIHAPVDEDGLWISHVIAQELNSKEAEDMRRGYSTGMYNSRGAHWVDPTAKPERDLAEEYRLKAEAVENAGYQRFAVTLRQLSDTYEREAEQIIRKHSIDISDA